jgi:AAA15 family ATPase/GTPase
MQLERFQVTNFRSIEDSGPIDVGEEVCLVGKNEAGKTAILNALTGLNPHPTTPFAYDKERDYPRRHLTDYSRRHKDTEALVYPAHTIIRYFLGSMTRKLSVTSSQ